MPLNQTDEIQFREAAVKAKTVGDLLKALPSWNRESVIHFNKETGVNKPFHVSDGKAKPLPPRANPKQGPKPAKGKPE